jgi:3' exoribonuclease, RNase T-like
MIIAYDTEFLERGPRHPVSLISVGLVREDGAEYYAINQDAPWQLIRRHEWLMAHVVPSLPQRHDDRRILTPRRWACDYAHPDVRPRARIAREARDFILAAPRPELWADYGAYDHVVLCQLWGDMTRLPEGIPMWTHDLRQEREQFSNPVLPNLPSVVRHNALVDAREVMYRLRWLRGEVT